MNRAEMLHRKEQLEKDIELAVRQFQNATGLTVTYVELLRTKTRMMGKPGDGMRFDTVKTTIKLTENDE